ncbi:MAG: hypothetical protein WC614_09345 [bacterium]
MKLKILPILIILASLDSSLFAQQSIGLKPSNIILNDLGKYQNNCLFIAGKGFFNNKYYEEPTMFNYAVEGASGYALGFVGFMGAALVSLGLMWGANDITADQAKSMQSMVLAMWMCGTALGSFGGVSLSGKLMKKNGSDEKAAVGTIAVAVAGWLLGYINEGFAITSLLVLPIGTVIGYNWK